jgi:dipeptidyl aminopeptidase/acylaminoacyl peptidase
MKAAGVEATLMTIEDGDHGFRTSSPDVKEKIEQARFDFFDRHLKMASLNGQ